jgi:hypothetical protein
VVAADAVELLEGDPVEQEVGRFGCGEAKPALVEEVKLGSGFLRELDDGRHSPEIRGVVLVPRVLDTKGLLQLEHSGGG